MATDFTSATILGSKTKTVSSEKLTIKTSDSTDNNIFDSILDNATKSYTDKEISSNTNSYASKEYAQNTKDLNKSNQQTTKSEQKETTQFKETESFVQKDSQTSEIKDSSEPTKSNDFEKTNDEPVQKESETIIKNDSETKVEKNEIDNNKEENFAQNKEQSQEQNNKTTDEETTQIETDNQNNNIEQEKLTNNQITNEQILANIEHVEEPVVLTTSFAEKILNLTPETLVLENNTNQDNIVNTNEQKQVTTPIKTVVTTEEQNAIENVVKNIVLNQQQNTEAISTQATEKLANTEVIEKIINQVSAETSETNVAAKINDSPDELVQNAKIEINTKNLTQKTIENLKNEIKTELSENTITTKTAKESLATDNSRILANVENMTDLVQEEPVESKLTTPMETAEVEEEIQLPRIKATESVAEQAKKQVVSTLENKDIAGEIKSKATAKMGEIESTSTVITEVKNPTNQQSQTQTNLGQQQNGTLTQNNAMEQAVKMSIEDVTATNSSESFLNKLDTKLNASAKTLGSQNSMLNKTDIMNQMNAKFNEMLQAGQNKVSVILQPENLGKVSVEIMNSKDGIVAKMTTDSQQVKELFDKNIETLKSNLSSQGVNVNNIKVECTQESSNNAMNFEREQFNQNFNNSSNQNNQTHQSKNQETTYSTEYNSNEEAQEEIETNTTELKNTETIIKHNGKVDYKV